MIINLHKQGVTAIMRRAVGTCFFLLATVLVFLWMGSSVFASDIEVFVDDEQVEFPDQAPYIDENNRTMVPVRFVSENLGAEVNWHGDQERVEVKLRGDILNLWIGEKVFFQNDEEMPMDTAPVVTGANRTMVPIRFVSEGLDADVEWHQEQRAVYIYPDLQPFPDIPGEHTGTIGEITIGAENLNVRKGPGIDYDVIAQVDEGDGFPILAKASLDNHPDYYEWYKIVLDKEDIDSDSELNKGWVAAEYVEKESVVIEQNLRAVDFLHWEERDNHTSFRLGPIERLPLDIFTLDNPHRLVLDLKDVGLNMDSGGWPVNSEAVSDIRLAEREAEGFTRVVFDLNAMEHYAIAWEDSHLIVNVFDHDPLKGETIMVDPGHGGKDDGAKGPSGLKEKDVVLDVSLRLRDKLEDLGAEVIMTREEDIYLSLDERAEMCNDWDDLAMFISVHANAHPDNSIEGTETFYSSSRSQRDFFLARNLQHGLLDRLGRVDRGVKNSRFRVLRNASVPAALVELAFISNPEEEQLLARDDFRQDSAKGLVDGVLNYHQRYHFQ